MFLKNTSPHPLFLTVEDLLNSDDTSVNKELQDYLPYSLQSLWSEKKEVNLTDFQN